MRTPHDRMHHLTDSGPWAITEDALVSLSAGPRVDVSAQAAARQKVGRGGIAVVPILGAITHRPRLLDLFGGTSVHALTAQVRAVSRHPDISTIVFDIDSPGGEVAGVEEFVSVVRSLPQRTVAVANTLAASAAYGIASATDEIVVTPSGLIGSVGVFGMHLDFSKQLEQDGVRPTFISAGTGKTHGNPFEPLSDDARSEMQEKVDTFYDRLVAMVAHGRRAAGQTVTDGMVRLRWGAKMFTAEEAVRLLMADRVGTLEQVVGQLAGRAHAPRSLRAEDAQRWVRAATLRAGTGTVLDRTADFRRRRRARLALGA